MPKPKRETSNGQREDALRPKGLAEPLCYCLGGNLCRPCQQAFSLTLKPKHKPKLTGAQRRLRHLRREERHNA